MLVVLVLLSIFLLCSREVVAQITATISGHSALQGQDEGGATAAVHTLDCVGAGITCGVDTGVMTLTVSSGVAGGSTTQLQYNNAGTLDGISSLIYDPATTTLPASGIKVSGTSGLGAVYTNPLYGNDANLRRAWSFRTTADGVESNPGFSTHAGMLIERFSVGRGHNSRDAAGKTSFANIRMEAQDKAQGQHFGMINTLYSYAMGDVFAHDATVHLWGGRNAVGDEGQGVLRLVADQAAPAIRTTIASVPAQSTCNTTLTQAITKSITPQEVTVDDNTGCAVNDRLVVDQGHMAGGNLRMEMVKVTAVGSGTITAQFRENHTSGATVVAATKLNLTSASSMGAGRYLVNLTATPYNTGTVDSIAGTDFNGSGTTWAADMVGGNAMIPGCIALAADDYTASPFSALLPLRGWFGIASVSSATLLNIAHSKPAATVASYSGNGPGSGEYTISPCGRALEFDSNTVYVEPNTFTWTAGDTVELPHSVDISLTAVIRAQAAFYSPNITLESIYAAKNFGQTPVQAAFSVSQGLVDDDQAGFDTALAVTATTSGAPLTLTGQSVAGLSLDLRTYDGDNKYIQWTTSQSPVRIGADYTTGDLELVVYTGPTAIVKVVDENDVYMDIRTRQWISNGVAFAALGTPSNGTQVYCTDCLHGSAPCSGSSTGAFARRINGAWNCE